MTVRDFLKTVSDDYVVTVLIDNGKRSTLIRELPVADNHAENVLGEMHDAYFKAVNNAYAKAPCSKKLNDAIRELCAVEPANILDRNVNLLYIDHLVGNGFMIAIDGPEMIIPKYELAAYDSVYGLTSAGFEKPFRDPRNVDNPV